MQDVAFDTESFPIGPGAICPRLVCLSAAYRRDGGLVSTLLGNGDPEAEDLAASLFDPGHMLVGQAVAFDVVVVGKMWPRLWPLIWDKLEREELDDTMIWDQLLAVSTRGEIRWQEMPDGNKMPVSYAMDALSERYLEENISALKNDDSSWRRRYYLLDGKRASDYPTDARDYALGDAVRTLRIREEMRRRYGEPFYDRRGPGSVRTSRFEAVVSVALKIITDTGMATDPVQFGRIRALVDRVFSNAEQQQLIHAGWIRPSYDVPYVASLAKAAELAGAQIDVEKWRHELRQADAAGTKANLLAVLTDVFGPHKEKLVAAGIKFTSEEQTKDTKAIRAAVKAACDETRTEPVRTKTGEISCAAEVVEEFTSQPHSQQQLFIAFEKRESYAKLKSTELPRVEWEGRLSPTVHFPYVPLVNSGRTASKAEDLYPSANGQNVHPDARPMYAARPGHVLFSIDYSALELCTAAQQCLDLFGWSKLADKLNAGYDVHSWLGSDLYRRFFPGSGLDPDMEAGYRQFKALAKTDPKIYKPRRDFAKPVNLGMPGGLGPLKFIGLAWKDYSVDVCATAATMVPFLQSQIYEGTAFLWNIENKLGLTTIDWSHPMVPGLALACVLKRVWLETYPEFKEFFRWVTKQEDPRHPGYLAYETPVLGMWRARVGFSEAANGSAMQSRAGHGAKLAVFQSVRGFEDPRSRLHGKGRALGFVHDEIIGEVREELTAEVIPLVQDLMVAAMQNFVPAVKIKTEAVLMRNWYKQAQPTFVDGRLVPWEPKP